MARFLVTYHGGSAPANAEQAERMRAAFGEWVTKAGKAIVDPGAPVRSATQVAKGAPLAAVDIGGYSIIQAASIDEAVAILRMHPFVARGGTLQLFESVNI